MVTTDMITEDFEFTDGMSLHVSASLPSSPSLPPSPVLLPPNQFTIPFKISLVTPQVNVTHADFSVTDLEKYPEFNNLPTEFEGVSRQFKCTIKSSGARKSIDVYFLNQWSVLVCYRSCPFSSSFTLSYWFLLTLPSAC